MIFSSSQSDTIGYDTDNVRFVAAMVWRIFAVERDAKFSELYQNDWIARSAQRFDDLRQFILGGSLSSDRTGLYAVPYRPFSAEEIVDNETRLKLNELLFLRYKIDSAHCDQFSSTMVQITGLILRGSFFGELGKIMNDAELNQDGGFLDIKRCRTIFAFYASWLTRRVNE